MYENLIKEYVSNLDEFTIKKFAKGNNIILNEEEVRIILFYIKNYWLVFYKEDPTYLFKELEEKINSESLDKIKKLYIKYKKKIN